MDGQVKVQVTFKTDYEATGLVTKGKKGQVCIASRGKVKKLCTEMKAGTSADVFIRG